MSDIRGSMKVQANGDEYTLFVGMSVLADLQAKHGQHVLGQLEAPTGAGDAWVPDLSIVTDLFLGALQRFHPDADRWLVDDIIAENAEALPQLMKAAFPDAKPLSGNVKSRSKKAAA